MSAEPGRWRNERVPYMVGVMDAVLEPGVEMIVVLKGTQIAFSETVRNLIGFWIDQDPGPCIVVMPSEQSARETFEERIKPLLFDTARLRGHVSGRKDDTKLSAIKLDSMSLYAAWAGSAQSLASRPIRFAVMDEVDKYPPFAGKEADPIRLTLKRLETYGARAVAFIGSSPTVRDGHISQTHESCGQKRTFRVPCPHCGVYQPMVWSQVKWPKRPEEQDKTSFADHVQMNNLSWYECKHCQAAIREGQKPKLLKRGVWADQTQTVAKDGTLVGKAPRSKRIGFTINAIYSPWVSFSKLAAEFITAQGNPVAMQDFRNSRLAQVYEHRVASTSVSKIREKVALSSKPGIVPAWALMLLATADTQKDHFYWVIRAWGADFRSQAIAYGMCFTFDELQRLCLDSSFRVEGQEGTMSVVRMLIDSGGGRVGKDQESRTEQVYGFALRAPQHVYPIKGSSHQMRKGFSGTPLHNGATLLMLDTHEYKNRLSRLIHSKDETQWLPPADANEDYLHQMASEHLVFDRKKRKNIWTPVSAGAANHYFDCEVYQTAAADTTGVGYMAPPDPNTQKHNPSPQPDVATGQTGPGGILGYRNKW